MPDRTVSAELRADVTRYIAAMRAASRATREFRDEAQRVGEDSSRHFQQSEESAGRLEQTLRRLLQTQQQQHRQQQENNEQQRRNSQRSNEQSESQNRLSRSTSNATRGLTAQRTTLISLVGAATAVSAGVASAGAAFAAFGVVAAPSIYKVVTAQQDLTQQWGTLSNLQRVSVVQTRGLSSDFKALAQSYEPQALAVYNEVVRTTHALLPKLDTLVGQTAHEFVGLTQRVGQFVETRGGEFLTWAGENAPRAVGVLGDTMTTAGDTALDLVQDIAPLGLTLLQLTNGALTAVNGLASLNPAVAQLAISALLLRAPILGAVGGISAFAGRVRQYSTATRGASLATRALGVASAAGPALYVAAGAALLYLAVRMSSVNDGMDGMLGRLRLESKAFNNNVAGHRAYAESLRQQAEAANEAAFANLQNSTAMGEATGSLADEFRRLDAEYQKQLGTIRKVEEGQAALAREFKISEESANRLATAAGIDLSQGVLKSGELTEQARQKISQYRLAVEQAADRNLTLKLGLEQAADATLTLKDRVTGLTAAYDAQLNPGLQAYQTTLQLREGFQRYAEALKNTKASMTGTNAASLQLQQAFGQQIASVRDLHTATFQKTRSVSAANAAVAKYIPVLYAMAGNSDEAREQVNNLAQALGFSTDKLSVSRTAFINQATAMFGSRARAQELWQTYQKLTSVTNGGSLAITTYIQRLRTSAEETRKLAIRTGQGDTAQQRYNTTVRNTLPVLYTLAGRNQTARGQVDALARSTGNATGVTNISRTAFMRAADSMGIARGRAEQLWKEYQKLPKQTNAAADGIQHFSKETRAAIHNLKGKDLDVTVYAKGEFRRATTAGLAAGGPVPAAGRLGSGGPTEDDVPIMASVGEHMWTAREVSAVGGHDMMYRMRAAALRGDLARFAVGGAVTFRARTPSDARARAVARAGDEHQRRWSATRASYEQARSLGAAWAKYVETFGGPGIAKALAWAKTQSGKPYIWGGVGPSGYDCSGFMSAILNVIQGRSPYSRRFTTHSFDGSTGPGGFRRSRPSGFKVGVTNAGVGHMAGTLGRGTAVESSGGAGVRVGGGARGHLNGLFPAWYGLAMAQGGAITASDRGLAARGLRRGADSPETYLAAMLGLAGDPSSPVGPGYAAGGWVHGRTGIDQVGIRATSGEFLVNRQAAQASPVLLEGINRGSIGDALLRQTFTTSAAKVAATSGGSAVAGQTVVQLQVHNHGAIGSRLEMEDWLVESFESIQRSGRAPWQEKK